MHTAALAALGLEPDWSYEAIEVSPDEFEARVRAMPGEGFVGANITVPHKVAALTLADEPSAAAVEIGATNTLTFADGQVLAENTDAAGFLDALPESPTGKEALVLGAGGSARAVVDALRPDVTIVNRTRGKAELLAREMGVGTGGADAVERADLVVNCTSVGMDGESVPVDPEAIRGSVMDLAYSPSGDTALIRAARARGLRAIDGIEVLVQQAIASLEIWLRRDKLAGLAPELRKAALA